MASSSGRSMSSMAQEEFGGCIPYDLGIMVIDEDITCLKLLQTLLSICHYRVISFTDANEALQNLWEKKNDFDLVMAEYRMSSMGGLELLERIVLGVNVPVITMCKDNDPRILSEALTNGACFHLTKPVSIQSLDVVWQKSWRNKGKLAMPQPPPRSTRSNLKRSSLKHDKRNIKKNIVEDEEKDKMQSCYNDGDCVKLRKPRLMWTSELHRRFLVAVTLLGRGEAIPSNILSLMNVEGLTIKQVASHLQKHRKRVEKLIKLKNERSRYLKSKPNKLKHSHLRTPDSLKRFKFPTTLELRQLKACTNPSTPPLLHRDHGPILPRSETSNAMAIVPNTQLAAEEDISGFLDSTVSMQIDSVRRSMEASVVDDLAHGGAKTNGFPVFGSFGEFNELQKVVSKNWEMNVATNHSVVDDGEVNNFLFDEPFLAWIMNEIAE